MSGKRIVVSGAAGAIGHALVRRLLRQNASVIGIDARPFDEDVLCATKFTAVKRGNPPDGTDNSNYTRPSETSASEYVAHIGFNLFSALAPINVLMPAITRARGNIVLTSSVNSIVGIGETPYSCAKAAVNSLAQNMATAHGPDGVNTNAVALGTIESPAIWASALERDPEVLNKIAKRIPRRKCGSPDEAAAVIEFLCSAESKLINGACIVADGGWTIAAGTSHDGGGNWFD